MTAGAQRIIRPTFHFLSSIINVHPTQRHLPGRARYPAGAVASIGHGPWCSQSHEPHIVSAWWLIASDSLLCCVVLPVVVGRCLLSALAAHRE